MQQRIRICRIHPRWYQEVMRLRAAKMGLAEKSGMAMLVNALPWCVLLSTGQTAARTPRSSVSNLLLLTAWMWALSALWPTARNEVRVCSSTRRILALTTIKRPLVGMCPVSRTAPNIWALMAPAPRRERKWLLQRPSSCHGKKALWLTAIRIVAWMKSAWRQSAWWLRASNRLRAQMRLLRRVALLTSRPLCLRVLASSRTRTMKS
mmetsp:Transcript_20090/g.29495  ORF Transcript_20090/g.29495 Transcript_20090/m.29495 type:complete len:207 (-) Transcript_20090:520-1140(-)